MQYFSAVISRQFSSFSLATGCQEGLFPSGSQVPGGTNHNRTQAVDEGPGGDFWEKGPL